MFYQPGKTPHRLPRDPFKACVVPRPIGWISTRSPDGVDNLAPFSQFNNLTFDPPYVMFSANQTELGVRKDTTINTEASGEFVWNMATYPLREAVNISADTLRLPGNPPMAQPIARCGYFQYTRISETFEMVIPGSGKVLYGLEGSAARNAEEAAAHAKEVSDKPKL
ncbi:hypothetical protein DTO271D3_2723 [Paecilomyces variotii]|nr:hypothetical protein DTO271D3_2723 [Paecilomyces variotii]KAJ9381874.1 hypothetical protein DTO063F5_6001 [Paecilomyces variotii]